MPKKTNKEKFVGNMIDANYWQKRESAEGADRDALIAGKTGDNLRQAWRNIQDGDEDENGTDPDPGPWEPPYEKEYRAEILAGPQYNEYAIHYMGLPGYIYRFLDVQPANTCSVVYELARHTREAGGKALRTFMMNGSRKASERYMFDALPWQMVKRNGRKVIDFEKRNDYFYECCQVIEEACKYWRIEHRPTMTMDRYNYDIYHRDNNIQGVDGYRSPEALQIKKQFIRDYLLFMASFRGAKYKPSFEIENEPMHGGDWSLGKIIADQNLEIFRYIQDLTDIAHVWTCSGTSEFSHAWFVEPQTEPMIIDGKEVYFGLEEFRGRLVKPEWHGTSTLASLLRTGWEHGLGSGWPNLANNEDGGADDGEYNPIPWTSYRQANYLQLKEMCKYAHKTAAGQRKTWYFTAFAMDCLEVDPADNVPKETYDLDNMNWRRYDAYKDARAELAGG
jgi:hypothetical protein